jgi:predicted MFS family arabinose efflux permease
MRDSEMCVLDFQLAINAASMVLYGVATNEYVILASRFLVGCANGIQWGLLEIASAPVEHRSRADVLISVRMGAYTLAFILGMGMAGAFEVYFTHTHT